MWTRSKTDDGKFAYSLYALDGSLVETVGGFATHTEADHAGEAAQRRDLFGDKAALSLDQILDTLSDDELLLELLA